MNNNKFILNKLLNKQIQKHLGIDTVLPEKFSALLNEISATYNQYEKAHYLLERTLDINSDELKAVNIKLYNDVLEREKTEIELKKINERYQMATKAANDAIWEWNFETNKLYWSEGYQKIFGYEVSSEDDNLMLSSKRVYAEDKRRVIEGLINKINNPVTDFWEDEYRYCRADGSIAHILDRAFVIYSNDLKPIRMIGAMQDITLRKKGEDLLKKSKANLRTILDNTDISYVLLDRDFKIKSFNQAAYRGYKKELGFDLTVGRNLMESVTCEKKAIYKRRHRLVLRGEKINYEINFSDKDGNITWYDVSMFPIHDHLKTIDGLIISSEDITQRKLAELEKEKITSDLIQRNKDLEQFAYIISHNLRSPVANIIGISDLILNQSELNEQDQKKLLKGMLVSAGKLDEVIKDLNFILQVRREINEKKETVNLNTLISDIQTSISELILKEQVIIKTDFVEISEYVTLKSYLYSVFFNLISNSIKYKNHHNVPVIEISSQKTLDKTILHYKDNGLGIDLKTNKDKIFGLYKRFHSHMEGKGIGLYMVKTQVEMIGGKIEIKSEVNKGTEFIIELAG